MTAEPLVLTFDVGTQSLRAMLVTPTGNFVDVVQEKYEEPYFSKERNWAEQKPNFYYDTLCKASKKLCEANSENLDRVIAVAITAIRDTTLCLDKNMKPLRDTILWLDKREAKFNGFSFFKNIAFKLAGMYDTAEMQYKATVANWIMDNEPEIWSKTAKYVMLPTYLNYKLTGKLKDSVANMIGHFPFDYKNNKWMNNNSFTRCIYDIPMDKLCELCNPGETIGKITKAASEITGIPEGLPLIATGSDKGCETLGLSVTHKGQAALSFGTTATIQIAADTYVEPQKFMPAYPAIIKGVYNPEIQIFSGYWLLSWFIREFGHEERYISEYQDCSPEDILDGHLNDVPAGCDGLFLQPYWSPGITIPNAKGSIIGFYDVHTKYHVYRAIIEGVGYALYEAMHTLEKQSKTPITELFIGGGGSKSDTICQITANMFGLPVKRIQTHEACGLGASLTAFVSMGVYKSYDEAQKKMIRVKDVFNPDIEEHKTYEKLFNTVYERIYPRLSPVYTRIKNIYKNK